MTKTKFLTLAALLAGAMALPVAGAQAKGISASDFKKADTDRSGTLSESEYSKLPGTTQSFSALDSNNDSVLTLSELQSAKSPAGSNSATGADSTASGNAGMTSTSGSSTNSSGSGYNGR